MISSEGSPDWLYRRAREHFVAGERDQAENYARQVIKLKPQHEGSLHMLAAISQAKEQEAATRSEDLRQQWAHRVNRLRESEERFQQGLRLLAQHQRTEAAQAFREALQLDPEHKPAREYVELFDREVAQASATAPSITTAVPEPQPTSRHRKPHPLLSLLLSLAMSIAVTYGIVLLFSTVIPEQENSLPLPMLLCGWVFVPLFILILGAFNPKDTG